MVRTIASHASVPFNVEVVARVVHVSAVPPVTVVEQATHFRYVDDEGTLSYVYPLDVEVLPQPLTPATPLTVPMEKTAQVHSAAVALVSQPSLAQVPRYVPVVMLVPQPVHVFAVALYVYPGLQAVKSS
jgi:hypothetical protein